MRVEEAFGIVLNKYRRALKITQENLALEANLDRTFISLLEQGKRKPTINTIFSIALVLKVSPSKIVKDVEDLLNV